MTEVFSPARLNVLGGGQRHQHVVMIPHRGSGNMAGLTIREVMVDLVGDHPDAVLPAQGQHALQLLPAPHPAHRVVRRAEQKHLHPLFRQLPLEIRKIYGVDPV